MNEPRILVACIGNIFLGDDGFGCEVARRLARHELPDGVSVVDYGIRSFDLAYALMDGYEVMILVDATPRGGEPGTLYTIEPDLKQFEEMDMQTAAVETHGMNPVKAIGLARSMGCEFKRVLIVGCEPATIGPEGEGQMGLSAPVEAAVGQAVCVIESLMNDFLGTRQGNVASNT
jgi:hydrogenase maturation protease